MVKTLLVTLYPDRTIVISYGDLPSRRAMYALFLWIDRLYS